MAANAWPRLYACECVCERRRCWGGDRTGRQGGRGSRCPLNPRRPGTYPLLRSHRALWQDGRSRPASSRPRQSRWPPGGTDGWWRLPPLAEASGASLISSLPPFGASLAPDEERKGDCLVGVASMGGRPGRWGGGAAGIARAVALGCAVRPNPFAWPRQRGQRRSLRAPSRGKGAGVGAVGASISCI